MTGHDLTAGDENDPVEGLIKRLSEVKSLAEGTSEREAALALAVEIVFRYWQAKMNKSGRVILDDKRGRYIKARLRENGCDVSELLYAIDGAKRDDWLMGRCDNSRKKFNGIQQLFRDREQVENLVEQLGRVPDIHPLLREK